MIKQIGLLLRGCPILLITCMITDRIGLHSVLLPLLIMLLPILIRFKNAKLLVPPTQPLDSFKGFWFKRTPH